MIIYDQDKNEEDRNLEVLSEDEIVDDTLKNHIVLEIDTDLVSGSLVPEIITLHLIDSYGRIINTDDTSVATINALDNNV